MEERGIGTTRRRCPGGGVTPTGPEYRVKRPVSLHPTVGSRSNFFHEFPKAGSDRGAWKRYDSSTVSLRRRYTDRTRVAGQKARISTSDRLIALKFFSRVYEGCFRWSTV